MLERIKRLFKRETLEDLGFEKIEEDEFGACYQKKITMYKIGILHETQENYYYHRIDILHKASNMHLIQSYELGVNANGFNNMVGMTFKQASAAVAEHNRLCRKYGWKRG